MSEATKKNLKIKCEKFWTSNSQIGGEDITTPVVGEFYYCTFDKSLGEYIIEVPSKVSDNGFEYFMFDSLEYKDKDLDYKFSIDEVDVDYVVDIKGKAAYGYWKEQDKKDAVDDLHSKIMDAFDKMIGPIESMDIRIEKDDDEDSHYGGEDDIQVVDLLESQGYAEGFYRGNIVKYVMRAGRKKGESEIKDLLKAMDYLEMEIERVMKKSFKGGNNEQ